MERLDFAVGALDGDFYKSRFTGYVAVSAVTAYEVNVRTSLIAFATRKHAVFGTFSASTFEKTNARVKLDMLRKDYLGRMGEKYLSRFNKRLNKIEEVKLRETHKSIKTSYNNLILWRHTFVHDGVLPQYANYDEARSAYDLGKEVIQCFCESLYR